MNRANSKSNATFALLLILGLAIGLIMSLV